MNTQSQNIVFIGGGLASTLALPLWAKAHNIDARYVSCILPNEHPDTFRLMSCVEKHLNIKIEDIGLNKTPTQLFREQKFIANSLHDSCSRVLKRERSKWWLKQNYPEGATLYIGIGAHEIDRQLSIVRNWGSSGYSVKMPLIDTLWANKKTLERLCKNLFGFIPELYEHGFAHNNCRGACVKAGQKQWLKLLDIYPDVFKEWEDTEEYVRQETGKDVAYLRKMENGVRRPYTLRELRETRQSDESEGSCSVCEAI